MPKKYYDSRPSEGILKLNEYKRLYRSMEEKRLFIYWKAGEIAKAKEAIGEIIAQANKYVIISDPYFNDEALKECVKGWVKCEEFTIYTSKGRLIIDEKGTDRGEELKKEIVNMGLHGDFEQAFLYSLSGGNNSFLHDRFIATENGVWCLGASLKNYAEKDTVLFKSPNPQAFLDRIEEWKTASQLAQHAELEWKWR